MRHKIICGDTLEVLKELPSESVDTIVTSPPYWKLRSYLPDDHPKKILEIGQESTLDEYISHLLEITKELKRVLKKTGVMFWNHDTNKINLCDTMQNYRLILKMIDEQGWLMPKKGPIIWFKQSHMPDSFKRGFTHSYEPIFMLVKDRSYWFNLDAVRVPHKEASKKRVLRAVSNKHKYMNHPEYGGGGGINKPRPNSKRKVSVKLTDLFDKSKRYHREQNMAISQYQYAEGDYLVVNLHPLGANPGDVWSVSTQSFKGEHFAVFPERLILPLIKVGSRQNDTVLDPFGGSVTVGVVAEKLERNSIIIDINENYCEMAYRRIKSIASQTKLFREPSVIERIGF